MNKLYQTKKVSKAGLICSFTAMLLTAAILYTGCSENGDPVDANGGSAKVAGKVTDSDGFGKIAKTSATVEGASIVLARVKADGTLETISRNEVTTGDDGKFLIETDVNGEANLVIVAKKGSKEWKGIVTSKVKTGITVYSQPVNEETTAEANVYVQAKAKGYKNVSYADIAAYINSTSASQIKNDLNMASKIAASLDARADVHVRAVSNSRFGGSSEKWNLILAGSYEAQAALERDLFYAESQAEMETAFNAYFKAITNTYVKAGLSAETYFRATEISQKAYLNNLSNFSAVAQFELIKRAAIVKAKVLNTAIISKFSAIGASNTQLNILANAHADLTTELFNASSESRLKAAFNSYNSVVIRELKASLGIHAILLGSLETRILNLKNSLQASVSGNVSTDALIDAYINFCTNLKAEVETSMAAAGKTNIDATVSLLILVHINA